MQAGEGSKKNRYTRAFIAPAATGGSAARLLFTPQDLAALLELGEAAMSGDFFLRYPRKDTSERARLRAALHEGEFDYRHGRYYSPRRKPFAGLVTGCHPESKGAGRSMAGTSRTWRICRFSQRQ